MNLLNDCVQFTSIWKELLGQLSKSQLWRDYKEIYLLKRQEKHIYYIKIRQVKLHGYVFTLYLFDFLVLSNKMWCW